MQLLLLLLLLLLLPVLLLLLLLLLVLLLQSLAAVTDVAGVAAAAAADTAAAAAVTYLALYGIKHKMTVLLVLWSAPPLVKSSSPAMSIKVSKKNKVYDDIFTKLNIMGSAISL